MLGQYEENIQECHSSGLLRSRFHSPEWVHICSPGIQGTVIIDASIPNQRKRTLEKPCETKTCYYPIPNTVNVNCDKFGIMVK